MSDNPAFPLAPADPAPEDATEQAENPAPVMATSLSTSLATLAVSSTVPNNLRGPLADIHTALRDVGGFTIALHRLVGDIVPPLQGAMTFIRSAASSLDLLAERFKDVPGDIAGIQLQLADLAHNGEQQQQSLDDVALAVAGLDAPALKAEMRLLAGGVQQIREAQTAAFTAIGQAFPAVRVACLTAAGTTGDASRDMDLDAIPAGSVSEQDGIWRPFRPPPTGMEWRKDSQDAWNLYHRLQRAWKSGFEADEFVSRSRALLAARTQLDELAGDVSQPPHDREDTDPDLEEQMSKNRSLDDMVRHDKDAPSKYAGFDAPSGYELLHTKRGWVLSKEGDENVKSVPFRILYTGPPNCVTIHLTQQTEAARGSSDAARGSGGDGFRGRGRGRAGRGGGRHAAGGGRQQFRVSGGVEKPHNNTPKRRPAEAKMWCDFHESDTHDTTNCNALRRQAK